MNKAVQDLKTEIKAIKKTQTEGILEMENLANCLKKSKLSHLDISGVNDPESIPHGQRICFHPKFDPQDENNPVKADIGLVILEEPLNGDEIPISQYPNISLKSCSKCQYRNCDVYQYQSSLQKYPLSQVISDTTVSYTSPKTDSALGLAAKNPDEPFGKIMADIIKQWSPSVDGEVEPVHFHDTTTMDDSWTENTGLDDYNLAPKFPLSENKGLWDFFPINQTSLPMESFENRSIPQPSGTTKSHYSSSDYDANSHDQSVIDSVKTQNHFVSDADRLQIVPLANIGTTSTSTSVPYVSLPADLETENPPHQIPYSTLLSQDQSSFKAMILPTAEIQPQVKAESEKTGHPEQS
ncbi:hypothetical protein STEG23_013792 [Scotinomys teguina]